jgi:taurine--2-oxoglutarate transaminase
MMATEPRALLGKKLAELCPGDIDVFFFTNSGSEANEVAIKAARFFTKRHKILARYRSYHGATAGSVSLTGDPRRWPVEPGLPGVIHVLDPYHGTNRRGDSAGESLAMLEEIIQLEGPDTIAAFILEPVTGSNGILIPPEGYLQGLRDICTRNHILLIADEVMTGFGRTGRWFAVNHWDIVPDIITMAKGLTSSYIPLGAVGMRRHIADYFNSNIFWSGLTYNSHPMACATALAVIDVYEQDRLVENSRLMGELMGDLLMDLKARHPSVGAVRSIGLFGVVELVRNRTTLEPLAAFNTTTEEMRMLSQFFRDAGLYLFIRWNWIFAAPPLCISEKDLREAFGIIDEALSRTDRALLA